jgi:transposase-like protein
MSEALVTNYDEIAELKGQLAELRQMLAELHEINAELHKDAQRLDWLLKTQSFLSINQIGTRKDIDKEME